MQAGHSTCWRISAAACADRRSRNRDGRGSVSRAEAASPTLRRGHGQRLSAAETAAGRLLVARLLGDAGDPGDRQDSRTAPANDVQ